MAELIDLVDKENPPDECEHCDGTGHNICEVYPKLTH